MLLSSDRKTATSVALTVGIFNCKKIAALNTNGHFKSWKRESRNLFALIIKFIKFKQA